MSRLTSVVLAALLALPAAAADKYPGIGRPATPDEIRAWDIDVRTDFKGLPPGRGDAKKGQGVWDEKCASCHGTFGESNEVFTPMTGGTTAADVKTGRVKALTEGEPRTTMMKLAHISTLWDYINRAMPWNAPKSLSTEEVYSVVAYILHLADLVPADFVLSDRNMAEAQALLPNRNGLRMHEGLWSVKGKGDVANVACMRNCPVEQAPASALPDFARGAHGNLADQQRQVGPTRGTDTVGAKPAAPPAAARPLDLARQANCMACHGVDNKVVGPSFKDVAKRYRGNASAAATLAARIKAGGAGNWGDVPMPANPGVKDETLRQLVDWILAQ